MTLKTFSSRFVSMPRLKEELAIPVYKMVIGLIAITPMLIFPAQVQAGIASTPLFLASRVTPNVFFMLDDSGSMDWTILSKKYWHPCAYDPDSGTDIDASNQCGGLITNGEMRSFGTRD